MSDSPHVSGREALFRAPVNAHYAQVHLLAKSSPAPMFETGEEGVVFAPTGVSVATSDWDPVLVEVLIGEPFDGVWPTQSILIGADGLEVGNDLAGDSHLLDWPAGLTTVSVEVVVSKDRVERVRFHLRQA